MLEKLIFETGIFPYNIQWVKEAAWGVVVAAVAYGAQYIQETNIDTVTDWQAWAIAGCAGLARVVVAVALGKREA